MASHEPTNDSSATRWWHSAVGYEVYLRSFSDGDGDGIGDLAGLIHRLDHLSALGVDLVWITPFYPSPMVDFGYDVADYTDVHPLYGDLEQFDQLVAAAHQRGIRIVADIVPNHSSDQHPWFVDALTGPDAAHRDYYIWADPSADGGPPNNWVSYFGGPAWTLDAASGQYYLHLFLPRQPDINWSNPAVLDAFDDVLRFWLDRGIDGFRIDVAQALAKDRRLRSNPEISPWNPNGTRFEQWDAFDHRFDVLQPEGPDIFRRWHALVEPYDALLLGETHVTDPSMLAELVPGDGLHVGFWFDPMGIEWSADAVRSTLRGPLAAMSDPRLLGWVAASHDDVRPPTRFGGGDSGRTRSLVFSTLLFGLPGLPFLYQGEELGLLEGFVPIERRADPIAQSRDGCRTPMPWEPGKNFGFSTADRTWLPDGGRDDTDTASWQRSQPDSWFHRYRALVEVRKTEPGLASSDFRWIDDLDPDVVAYQRGDIVVVANLGPEPFPLGRIELGPMSVDFASPGTRAATMLFTTDATGGSTSIDPPVLAPDSATIYRVDPLSA